MVHDIGSGFAKVLDAIANLLSVTTESTLKKRLYAKKIEAGQAEKLR